MQERRAALQGPVQWQRMYAEDNGDLYLILRIWWRVEGLCLCLCLCLVRMLNDVEMVY